MTERLLFRSASSTDHSTYTGVRGEVTIDSTNNNLIVHDGVTSGGNFPTIAAGSLSITAFASSIKPVEIVSSLPTSDNEDGRMVFLTVDKKLYRYDSSAGSFTAAVNTSDLTGTISGAQIAAGSIVAGHITSDSITTGMIQTGAISSDEIAVGALTLTKMSTSQLVTNNVTVQIGVGASVGGYTAGGSYNSGSSSKYGLLVVNTAGGNALGAGAYNSSGDSMNAVVGVGNATSTSFTAWESLGALGSAGRGVVADHNVNGSVDIYAHLATSTYAGYFSGNVYTTGSYLSFTGSHDALINPGEGVEGDIVIDVEMIARISVSDTLTKVAVSSTARQKGAVGVYVKTQDKENIYPVSISNSWHEEVDDNIAQKLVREIKPEYVNIYAAHDLISINSLGEGQINCVGEGGNLEIGDLIVTSSTQGKGMKQTDDILRSVTVAKSRENVNFENGEVKLVACIYLCG